MSTAKASKFCLIGVFRPQFCTLISYNSSTNCEALYDSLITLALRFKHFSSF